MPKAYEYDSDKRLTKITNENMLATNYTYGTDPYNPRSDRLVKVEADYLLEYGYSVINTGEANSYVIRGVQTATGVGSTGVSQAGDLILNKSYSNGTRSSHIDYTYNPTGLQQTSETLSAQRVGQYWLRFNHTTNQFYDADGLLTKTGNLLIQRDAASGLPIQKTLGNFVENISYNNFGEIYLREVKFAGTLMFKEQYGRDKLGRIISKEVFRSGSSKVYAYEYDLKGRLKQTKEDGAIKNTYNYDAQGNRLSMNGNFTAMYDSRDRITEYTKDANRRIFTYSADETSISKQLVEEQTNVTYSISRLNHLRSVVNQKATRTSRVTYDPNGELNRVQRFSTDVDGTVTTRLFAHDKNHRLIQDYKFNIEELFRYVYATQSHSPDYMVGVTNSKEYFLIKDQVGSILQVIDENGAVVQDIVYDDFGQVLSDSNPGFQTLGFAGGHYDHETGLVRFGARDYDGEIGRWLERDPIGFEGGDTNLYGYCNNDPVNCIDPSGLAGDRYSTCPPKNPPNPISCDEVKARLPVCEAMNRANQGKYVTYLLPGPGGLIRGFLTGFMATCSKVLESKSRCGL